MALFGICFSSSNQNPLLQTHKTMHHLRTHIPTSIIPPPGNAENSIRKRSLNLSIVAYILSIATPTAKGEEENIDELQRYTDSTEGFTLLRPSSYVKVDKAGATVLFEEASKGPNNVGVVVSPVRLTSLRDFGSPLFVAEKLVQAEKRKVTCPVRKALNLPLVKKILEGFSRCLFIPSSLSFRDLFVPCQEG